MKNNYLTLSKLNEKIREDFFVAYAVRGPELVPGTRQDLPVNHPISGPVKEPSPLNTRYIYEKKMPKVGIF